MNQSIADEILELKIRSEQAIELGIDIQNLTTLEDIEEQITQHLALGMEELSSIVDEITKIEL